MARQANFTRLLTVPPRAIHAITREKAVRGLNLRGGRGDEIEYACADSGVLVSSIRSVEETNTAAWLLLTEFTAKVTRATVIRTTDMRETDARQRLRPGILITPSRRHGHAALGKSYRTHYLGAIVT
jgi:hypothetical protein